MGGFGLQASGVRVGWRDPVSNAAPDAREPGELTPAARHQVGGARGRGRL